MTLTLIESYVTDDKILPEVIGEHPRITIDIYDDRVVLQIGPRDFCWMKGCPDPIGSGFSVIRED